MKFDQPTPHLRIMNGVLQQWCVHYKSHGGNFTNALNWAGVWLPVPQYSTAVNNKISLQRSNTSGIIKP